MNRYQMVKAIQDNIEWLSTTEGDEVQCISIENLEAILEIDLKLAEEDPSQIVKNTIKEECEDLYKIISDAETRLYEIRRTCKHPKTYVGNWSNRPGAISTCNICVDCGQNIGELSTDDLLNFPHKQLDIFKDGVD